MLAVTWHGKKDVRVERVADPKMKNRRDAIIRVTLTAICGSDLHLYDGVVPAMKSGDILGHEFMGIVEETGPGVANLKRGDRVVVPFTICCGSCWPCQNQLWSLCDNSNPKGGAQAAAFGDTGAGLFGYSHLYGGFAGGQAQFVRVPFADVGPLKIESGLNDEQVLFLSDIFPTAYMAAENCQIQPGDTVAIWGCGPVGLLAIRCCYMLGAEKVIAIDRVRSRMEFAREQCNAITVHADDPDLVEMLKELTGGRGPDACMDAVGSEAHGMSLDAVYDYAKFAIRMQTDRPHVLRQAIQACRKGGTISIPGVYGGFVDKFPIGIAFGKGLTFKMGQTHMLRYMRPLLDRIQQGDIDPSFIISKKHKLSEAPEAYERFGNREPGYRKVVLDPSA